MKFTREQKIVLLWMDVGQHTLYACLQNDLIVPLVVLKLAFLLVGLVTPLTVRSTGEMEF